MKKLENKILVDTTIITKYVTLQHAYRELYKDFVKVFEENEKLRKERGMNRRSYELPMFPEVKNHFKI